MKSSLLPLALLGAIIIAITTGTAGLILYQQQRATTAMATTSGNTPTAVTNPASAALTTQLMPRADRQPESMSEVPRESEQSTLTALNPEKTLYLETRKHGTKRLLFSTEVCLREGVSLEVFLCKKQTKEHEAILRTDIEASLLHAGLIAAGAKPGHPVRFVNPETDKEEYQAATGEKLAVTVYYKREGQVCSHPAQEWIWDRTAKKPMTYDWVFAGSRFVGIPDRPNAPPYYCANNGEIISISNFMDSMLDLPVRLSDLNDELNYEAIPDKIPAIGSKVWVSLEKK